MNKNMKKRIIVSLIIVSIIIVSIISLIIGFGMGKISEKANQQVKISQAQEEIDLLKSQLETVYPPLQEEVYSIDGTVTEVGDKFLVMEAQIRVSQFPLPEGKDYERRNIKVNVIEETEIFQTEIVAPKVSEEMPLEPFEKVLLSFEDIKTGDYIMVNSEENIKGKKEITAKEIQIVEGGIHLPY